MGRLEIGVRPSRGKAIAGILIVAVIAVRVFVGRDGTTGGTTFDPATVTCDNAVLTNQAKSLVETNDSPILGKITVLKARHYRKNPTYGKAGAEFSQYGSMSPDEIQQDIMADRSHQCAADMVTSRGEMTMYYGWKKIDGDLYVEALAIPNSSN